jgi:hypothetical protein
MRRFLLLGAAVALSGPLMLGQATAAGTAAPQMNWAHSAAADGAIVGKVDYRNYKRWCGKWTRKCTRRWNWGTKRYARCMWRHGC